MEENGLPDDPFGANTIIGGIEELSDGIGLMVLDILAQPGCNRVIVEKKTENNEVTFVGYRCEGSR